MIAYYLLRSGESDITIIEKGTIGSGATGHSAGMLVCDPEGDSWTEILNKFGRKIARETYENNLESFRDIKQLISQARISCGAEEQQYIMLSKKDDRDSLRSDLEARQKLDIPVSPLKGGRFKQELNTNYYNEGERTFNNLSVNPLKLALGIAKYLKQEGVQIFEQTAFSDQGNRIIKTIGGKHIKFNKLILALGTKTKVETVDTFLTTIAITRKLNKKELKLLGLADRDSFNTMEVKDFYFGKITTDNRLLIGYGDLKLKSPKPTNYIHKPHLNNLVKYFKRLFPQLELNIEYSWSHAYALSEHKAVIKPTKGTFHLTGRGTQLSTIAEARQIVAKILASSKNN